MAEAKQGWKTQSALKNGQRIEIAEAGAGDAADVLRFLNRVGGESDNLAFGPGAFRLEESQEAVFLEEQAALPTSVVLVGRVQGAVAALASLAGSKRERTGHTAELTTLVGKENWGQGVGGAMMQALLDWARATHTLRVIHLGVRADNRIAIRLYRRFGFVETGRLKNFYCMGEDFCDKLIMSLEL